MLWAIHPNKFTLLISYCYFLGVAAQASETKVGRLVAAEGEPPLNIIIPVFMGLGVTRHPLETGDRQEPVSSGCRYIEK